MSVLRSLESKLAGLVEGTFSRAFKSEVRPVEIARKLAKEMDQNKVQSLSRVYAPNEYAVWLSPDDRKQFEGYEDELARELSGYLLEHARRERIALLTSPQIEFKTDERLRLGEFGIQARLVRPPAQEHDPPSQGDEGHTMVYSTSARVSEPLREPDPRRGQRAAARRRPRRGRRLARRRAGPLARLRRRARRPQRLPPPRRGAARPAGHGSSTISARPTASRSTGAASKGRSRSSAATSSNWALRR